MAFVLNKESLVALHRNVACSFAKMMTQEENETVIKRIERRMEAITKCCESPLEDIFAWYWTAFSECQPFGDSRLVLEPQTWFDDREFGQYRFDFSVVLEQLGPLKIAIELDGHTFHEKTREQVNRRNDKDRRMQLHGWKMLHFSGDELLREQMSCAGSAWLVAYQRAHRWGWLDAVGSAR